MASASLDTRHNSLCSIGLQASWAQAAPLGAPLLPGIRTDPPGLSRARGLTLDPSDMSHISNVNIGKMGIELDESAGKRILRVREDVVKPDVRY